MKLAPILLAYLCLPVLASCGSATHASCAAVGCSPALRFQSPRVAMLLTTGAPLTIRVCLDGQCVQSAHLVSDGCGPDLLCGGDSITMLVSRPGDLTASTHTASITITRSDGTIPIDERFASVRFTRHYPSGPACPPTCYLAAVHLRDA
jgi:hypothetical protein